MPNPESVQTPMLLEPEVFNWIEDLAIVIPHCPTLQTELFFRGQHTVWAFFHSDNTDIHLYRTPDRDYDALVRMNIDPQRWDPHYCFTVRYLLCHEFVHLTDHRWWDTEFPPIPDSNEDLEGYFRHPIEDYAHQGTFQYLVYEWKKRGLDKSAVMKRQGEVLSPFDESINRDPARWEQYLTRRTEMINHVYDVIPGPTTV
jgi:hypothetical protein